MFKNKELYEYRADPGDRIVKIKDIDWSHSIKNESKKILVGLINYMDKVDTEFTLDMNEYISNREYANGSANINIYEKETFCGTICCLAGLIPHIDIDFAKRFLNNDTKEQMINFSRMSHRLVNNKSTVWDFLFAPDWDNNRQHARQRLLYYCFYGDTPDDFGYEYVSYEVNYYLQSDHWHVLTIEAEKNNEKK